MNTKLNVLIIEDEESVCAMLKMQMARLNTPINLKMVRTLMEGIDTLKSAPIDVVLLDLGLPDSYTDKTIQSIPEICQYAPVVVLTGLDSEEAWSESIKNGANDYLVKQFILDLNADIWLAHSIWNAVLIHRRDNHGKAPKRPN